MKEPIEVEVLQQVTAIVDQIKDICPMFQLCHRFQSEIVKEEHEGNETRYFLTCKNYTDKCREETAKEWYYSDY